MTSLRGFVVVFVSRATGLKYWWNDGWCYFGDHRDATLFRSRDGAESVLTRLARGGFTGKPCVEEALA